MADILRIDPARPDPVAIARAALVLRSGGLVAFPTETVYGLGADATSPSAVERIFTAKGRPATDPLIVHVPDLAAAAPFVSEVPDLARDLAAMFWPGPLTLILPRTDRIPAAVSAGRPTVAIRVPSHPVALALVREAGIPIAAPSANLFSRPSPTTADHVVADLGASIDLVLDAGSTPIGVESTVLDLTQDPPTVLRPGGVPLEALRARLPAVQWRTRHVGPDEAAPAPGLALTHYAPRTPLTLFQGAPARVAARVAAACAEAVARQTRVVILATPSQIRAIGPQPGGVQCVVLGPDDDADATAAGLYQRLRDCDALGADAILGIQWPDSSGVGLAIQDRLARAASGRVITVS